MCIILSTKETDYFTYQHLSCVYYMYILASIGWKLRCHSLDIFSHSTARKITWLCAGIKAPTRKFALALNTILIEFFAYSNCILVSMLCSSFNLQIKSGIRVCGVIVGVIVVYPTHKKVFVSKPCAVCWKLKFEK